MNLLSANEILLCWQSKNVASFIKLIQKLYSDTLESFVRSSWLSELRLKPLTLGYGEVIVKTGQAAKTFPFFSWLKRMCVWYSTCHSFPVCALEKMIVAHFENAEIV